MIPRSKYFIWPALMAAAACGSQGDQAPGHVVADSAGVRVVTHSGLAAPTWTVVSTPLLSLGTIDGDGPESFFRISSAVRTEDGTITVFNASSADARQFGSDGAHLRTIGRQGQGPGEFMGGSRLKALSGNRVAIWDTRARRLTIVDQQGAVERTIQPEGIERRPRLIAVLDDGSTLFEQEIPIYELAPLELRQDYSNYIRWAADGSVVDTLPLQEKVEVVIWGEGPMAGPPLFGTATAFAGDGTGYWVGGQKSEELTRYSFEGVAETVVRWPAGDRAIGTDDPDLWLVDRLETVTDDELRGRVIDLHNGTPVADRFPAYGELFVDRVGMLWVQEFERPGRVEPSRWWVLDREGLLRGEVRLPTGYRIFDIGADYILAQRSDELGVEYVDLLTLSRPAS